MWQQSQLPGALSLCIAVAGVMMEAPGSAASWPRPFLPPVPDTVPDTETAVMDLGGPWHFTLTPPAECWRNDVDPSAWPEVQVPGEPWMQGFQIEHDVEYPFKRRVAIPDDFAGKRILLRFDGVYSRGRVWVNGQFAGEHTGGFTAWTLDITDQVTPGQDAWITVGVTDLREDLSFASGYAGRYLGDDVPHRIGGILRPVRLVALPRDLLSRLHVETDLDEQYEHAVLQVTAAVDFQLADATELRLTLRDPDGIPVPLDPDVIALTSTEPEQTVGIPVTAPRLWDAEHPHLFTLEASLWTDGQKTQQVNRRIGFREILLDGNRFLVNGKEVKLRGGCRHSVHPLAGRSFVPGLAAIDAVLYKHANFNYVRTSHYPPDEEWLEAADRYGLYVEEEFAICWIDHHAANGILNGKAHDGSYLPWFMNAAAEAMERDRSHPCILIWSLGNENVQWGPNLEQERDFVRAEDPTRPLKTGHNHYKGGWNSDAHTDLDSYHYPGWNSNFTKEGKPYLYDEYVHVITYYRNDSTAEQDPNIRTFWGESMDRFWEGMFPAAGTLGGAIWGTVDDVFMAPEACIGYGRWGIFDGWRRPKPEHWLTKKAYSPIRLSRAPLAVPPAGQALRIPVKNWFDHTDFKELDIHWAVGGEEGVLRSSLAPHTEGEIVLPARNWRPADRLRLRFVARQKGLTYLVDTFDLPLKTRTVEWPARTGPAPVLEETGETITLTGPAWKLVFDKATGLLRSGVYQEKELLTGGPFLNLSPYPLEPYQSTALSTRSESDHVVVELEGTYGSTGLACTLRIDGTGLIQADYTLTDPPEDAGAYDEVGLEFALAGDVEALEWDRRSQWSVFPGDHIGRPSGRANRVRTGPEWIYRQAPSWPWAQDMKEFHQRGKDHAGYGMTHDFRGAKEQIFHAAVVQAGTGHRLRVESDGASHAVRMKRHRTPVPFTDDRDAALVYTGTWVPYADPGDARGTEMYSNDPHAAVEYTFEGTSVTFISARNNNLGKVDIFLDGELAAEAVDAYATSKQHQQTLFAASDLTNGSHTLRVVVRGDSHPEAMNTYAQIDGFSIVPQDREEDLNFRISINRHSAYSLGWGNYNRKSSISSGFTDTVYLRMTDVPLVPENVDRKKDTPP